MTAAVPRRRNNRWRWNGGEDPIDMIDPPIVPRPLPPWKRIWEDPYIPKMECDRERERLCPPWMKCQNVFGTDGFCVPKRRWCRNSSHCPYVGSLSQGKLEGWCNTRTGYCTWADNEI